jgi:hypothetical protein
LRSSQIISVWRYAFFREKRSSFNPKDQSKKGGR